MSAFILKIIACITMFIDHIGYCLFGTSSYFNYIGRIAFPIFAYQISQGYVHTKNLKKYLIRLAIFALISQLPYMLFHSIISDTFAINVIFTLLFGILGIIIYDKTTKLCGILSTISLAVIAQICKFDYGFYGVAIVFLFYLCRNSKLLTFLAFSLATILNYAYKVFLYAIYGEEYFKIALNYYIPYCLFTIASAIFICLYNKKKGPNTKYLLYLFYPLHLLLIYGINLIIN